MADTAIEEEEDVTTSVECAKSLVDLFVWCGNVSVKSLSAGTGCEVVSFVTARNLSRSTYSMRRFTLIGVIMELMVRVVSTPSSAVSLTVTGRW